MKNMSTLPYADPHRPSMICRRPRTTAVADHNSVEVHVNAITPSSSSGHHTRTEQHSRPSVNSTSSCHSDELDALLDESEDNKGNSLSQPESVCLLFSRLQTLRKQESGPYKRIDYLSRTVAAPANASATSACSESCREDNHSTASTKKSLRDRLTSSIRCGRQHGRQNSSSNSFRTIAKTVSSDSVDSQSTVSTSSTHSSTSSNFTTSSSNSDVVDEGSLPIDAECRSVMLTWFLQVLDHCHFSRDNGAVAAYLLDLYLSTDKGMDAQVDRRQFQLVSMTCLFLAIKMNECETITPAMIARLSRGSFDALDVAQMETILLRTIHWHVYPPTASTFLSYYLELLRRELEMCDGETEPAGKDGMEELLESIAQYARLQIDQSCTDYYYVTVGPSTVAYAAIVNAASSLDVSDLLDSFYRRLEVNNLVDVDKCNDFYEVRERLLDGVVGEVELERREGTSLAASVLQRKGNTSKRVEPKSPKAARSPGRRSPRCVSRQK